MANFFVSGHINIETTLAVEGFPVPYRPAHYPFFGIHSSVSGVGYNLAKALTALGGGVRFFSLIGRDMAAEQVRAALAAASIDDSLVLGEMEQTAQSVILYDPAGRRQAFSDLKDVQERRVASQQAAALAAALAASDVAVLCNINYSRPLLAQAQAAGKLVATDVHAVSDLEDDYNRDFMQAADVLFMSGDLLPAPPEEWAEAVLARYASKVLVIGLGAEGALLALGSGGMERLPAIRTRPVVSTIGAGDALFAAFLHGYAATGDAYGALRRAIVFASYKIGVASAADGFLDATALDALQRATYPTDQVESPPSG